MNAELKTRLRLDAMALEIPEVAGHPNRAPFSGVLTHVDRPSDAPPAGADGHLVVLPAAVAEAALPSLLGMAVNFSPDARGHAVRRKIGVITEARVEGGELRVAGHLFAKDFPDAVREIRARRDEMGMSYEITHVEVEDVEAETWVLANVVFTGAAILEKDAAAFKRTSLAATAGADKGEAEMEEKELKKTVFASIEEWFRTKFSGGTQQAAASTSEADVKRIAAEAAAAVKTELGAQITALTEENKALKAGASNATQEARRAKWIAARDAAQKTGKLVPALLPGLNAQAELAIAATAKVKVMETQADKSEKEVEVDALDALLTHVATLPQIVPLGDLAGEAQRQHSNVVEMKFNETRDLKVDPASQALNAAAELIAADLRKQNPKLTELEAFKEGLRRAGAQQAARAGDMTAGQA